MSKAPASLPTRKSLVILISISTTILFSLTNNYVNLSRSQASNVNAHPFSRLLPQLNDTVFYDSQVEETFLVPQTRDVEYVGRLRSNILLNQTAAEVSPLESCSPTVQVQIIVQKDSNWLIQSIDENGRNKTVGGDEFYVTYSDSATNYTSMACAVALVDDQGNGAYRLRFSTTPMASKLSNIPSVGTFKVSLQYTCGIGQIPQPSKNSWPTGGYCMASWTRKNVTQPPIRQFTPPTDIDFSPYSLVVSFGDSLMEGLVRGAGKGAYFRNQTSFKANIWQFLNLETLPLVQLRLDQFHAKELNASNVALVLGSSVWDILEQDNIQGRGFKDHLEACRQFIQSTQEKYPHVALYWKSPSALHIHRVRQSCFTRKSCNKQLRYMSNSRAKYLYEEQKKIAHEMSIPFIDLFEAYYLSADWTMWSDGRHFVSEFNRRVLSWLYSSEQHHDHK
jgi:hypothetical protein